MADERINRNAERVRDPFLLGSVAISNIGAIITSTIFFFLQWNTLAYAIVVFISLMNLLVIWRAAQSQAAQIRRRADE